MSYSLSPQDQERFETLLAAKGLAGSYRAWVEYSPNMVIAFIRVQNVSTLMCTQKYYATWREGDPRHWLTRFSEALDAGEL